MDQSDGSFGFSRGELLVVGCRSCVWKLFGQCPHGLKDKGELGGGICGEMVDFLRSLGGGSSVGVLENFFLWKARLMEGEDFADFVRLNERIKVLEEEVGRGGFVDSDVLGRLRMERLAAKVWWGKLNAHVVQGLGRVRDREVRQELVRESVRVPGIQSSGTINFNIVSPNPEVPLVDKVGVIGSSKGSDVSLPDPGVGVLPKPVVVTTPLLPPESIKSSSLSGDSGGESTKEGV